jgi:hypothetical protein
MFILFLFFGVLLFPCYIKKIRQGYFSKRQATVIHIYFSQPDLSYVQLELKDKEKRLHFKEMVAHKIKKNDEVVVYTDHDLKNIIFQKPNPYPYIALLVFYVIILIFILYIVYDTMTRSN